jgi:hypothetical protein
MRTTLRIFVVPLLALGAVALAAFPSSAGAPATNTVVVQKQVTGNTSVPPGTTFTVEVTCESILTPAAQAPTPVEVTFDAAGQPTSDNTITAAAGTQCTVQETDRGGASNVSYSCAMDRGPTDEDGPPFLGNCSGTEGNQVTFGDVIGDTATITVSNDFETAPAPPIEPVTPAAQAVQAAPTFTG